MAESSDTVRLKLFLALDTIKDAGQSDRLDRFRDSFALVTDFRAVAGEDNLADRLLDMIPEDFPWKPVADLLSILLWSTSDNGHAISLAADSWLRKGQDVRRIQIALHLDAYPFVDKHEMTRVLRTVSIRFPEVAERCSELVAQRERIPE